MLAIFLRPTTKGRCAIKLYNQLPPRKGQYVPSDENQATVDRRCEVFVRDMSAVSLGSLLEYIGGHDEYETMQAIRGMFPIKLGGASNQSLMGLVRALKIAGSRIPDRDIESIAQAVVLSGEEVIPAHASKYIVARIMYRAAVIQRGLDRQSPEAQLLGIDKAIRSAANVMVRGPKRELTEEQKKARASRRSLKLMLDGLF